MPTSEHSELLDVLDGWSGSPVAVRVVAGDDLLVVCVGLLGQRSEARHPAYFWPLAGYEAADVTEQAGIYVHPQMLTDVRVHVGAFVVEYRQAGVEINVRRLDSSGR